jgi:hypothetical protein
MGWEAQNNYSFFDSPMIKNPPRKIKDFRGGFQEGFFEGCWVPLRVRLGGDIGKMIHISSGPSAAACYSAFFRPLLRRTPTGIDVVAILILARKRE